MCKEQSKIILLDWGMFLFRSVYSWRRNREIPAEYTCLNMIVSALRRVGVSPYDKIIVAVDYGKSWRKEVDTSYKADRQAKRDKDKDIDWKEMFSRFNYLLDVIDESTEWHVVKAEGLEADDWMSGACRYFKNNEIILVTFDADMEQLVSYENVKVFSPLIKIKGGKGGYKIIKNPYQILAKKIEKESADNLKNPILTKEDFEKRKTIVSLLELPDYIESQIKERFNILVTESKTEDLDKIPFKNIRARVGGLYNDKSKIVTYKDCLESLNRKKKRRAKNGKKKRDAKRSKKG